MTRGSRITGCAVFAITAAAYVTIGPDAPQGGDTVPNRYLPLAVACGDLTLDRFTALWRAPGSGSRDGVSGPRTASRPPFPYFATAAVDGALVSTFGPAVPVLSFPFYAAVDAVRGIRDSRDVLAVSRILAGLLCALAAVVVFVSCRMVASLSASLLATAAFAFGSGVLSVTSRGLWQHTWATPMLAVGMWALLWGRGAPSRRVAVLAGAAFAVAFACRPQAGLFLVAGGFALARARRDALLAFCLAAFPILALVFAYNTWHFDSPFAFAQTLRSRDVALFKTGSASLLGARPWEAALGLLASPSRGLLVFSPGFAMGIATLAPRWPGRWRRLPAVGTRVLPEARATLICLSVAGLGVFLTAALWFDWWGGYTVSYRPLLDLLPLLAVLTAVGLDRWPRARVRVLFAAALAWSIVLAASAALHPGVVSWNEERDVDRHPERLWSLTGSLPERILEFRPEDRVPLRDSRDVVVIPCGVTAPDGLDFSHRPPPW